MLHSAFDKSLVPSAVRVIAKRPVLLAHIVACFTVLNLCIQNPCGMETTFCWRGLQLPFWTVNAASCGVFYVALGVSDRLSSRLFTPKTHAVCMGGAFLLGSLLQWLAVGADAIPSPGAMAAFFAGSVFVGFSMAMLLIELAYIFSDYSPRVVLCCNVAAVLASLVIVTCVRMAATEMRFAFMTFAAPVLGILEYKTVRSQSRRNAGAGQEHKGMRSMPFRFMTMATAMGLANGLMAVRFASYEEGQAAAMSALCLACSAVLMLAGAVLAKLDFNRLIYQVGFPVCAMGAVLLSVGRIPEWMGLCVQLSGFYFAYFVVWGLCVLLMAYLKQPAMWTVSYSTACLMLGQFSGALIGRFFAHSFGDGALELVSAGIAIALFMVAVLNAGDKSFMTGWGTTKPASKEAETTFNRNETLDRMSALSGLTAREREVFAILAQGRSRQMVQRELVISDNTAKAHIRNIYKKLGVHSLQELLDAIERNDSRTHSLE